MTASRPSGFDHAKHHFSVALVVASVLTLLHQGNLLNWLDSLVLRMVGPAPVTGQQAANQAPSPMPVVLKLGDSIYEHVFKQRSPLDRGQLATLVKTVAAQCPSVFVIDLDLSPGPSDPSTDAEQLTLNAALKEIAGHNSGASGRCQPPIALILPIPVPVATEELMEIKGNWVKDMCDAGVHFGLYDVNLSQGKVLQFDPQAPTLGALAAIPNQAGGPCEAIARTKDPASVVDKRTGGQHGNREILSVQRPFNAKFFAAETQNTFPVKAVNVLPLAANGQPIAVTRRAVFLGGGYEPSDRFQTAFGDREGVIIHAASYFSIVEPVTKIEGWLAFLLDVALGFAFGYLFHWTWRSYDQANRRLHTSVPARWVKPYLATRGWLLGNFIILLGSVVVLVGLSVAYIYPKNVWINAGPVILGVFLKSVLGSRVGLTIPRQTDASKPTIASKIPPQAARCDQLIATTVILWCVAVLTFGDH